MKSLIIDASIYFTLALGCIIVSQELAKQGIWHDVLLLVGGILLGGLCAMVTLIRIKYPDRAKREKEV